uniref:UPF0481 protein At3g47200-like n=1 Tax=Elaeis guineensis var. tenera TaxID=51953 RepID=A0A8N4IB60_ELAGV|nr:UPF0481 protein At3g47200-like [Elaeis guineensis]
MAEIMLLDGCFIIHLLLEHAEKEREEEKKRREQHRGETVLEMDKKKKEECEIMGKGKREKEQASGVGGGKSVELRQVGVKFRKKEKGANFLDITFHKGRMEIPPLWVTDHTCSLFRNLIAFEQCYAGTKAYVTTYAVFMDCIIDEAKDAQLLHLKGIVVNRLSTDKALAGLFNKLCNQIHYSPDKDYLRNLFTEVNKYYNSKHHKWWAVLKRNYLSNPWAIASVTAAVLLLLLTIEQAVFAGFSYLLPPKGS